MKVLRKIMEGLQKIQNHFIAPDTSAFIYDKRWRHNAGDSANGYIKGKHRNIQKENILKYFEDLGGDNRVYFYETILAYSGVFTIPFVRRMMQHYNVNGSPYVQYWRKTSTPINMYLTIDLPGMATQNIWVRTKDLLCKNYTVFNSEWLHNDQLKNTSSEFPKLVLQSDQYHKVINCEQELPICNGGNWDVKQMVLSEDLLKNEIETPVLYNTTLNKIVGKDLSDAVNLIDLIIAELFPTSGVDVVPQVGHTYLQVDVSEHKILKTLEHDDVVWEELLENEEEVISV